MLNTFTTYNVVSCIFSALALFSNLGSLIYIKKTFDTKQCLHYILCLDAIVVLSSSLISLMMFAILISNSSIDAVSCSMLFCGTLMTVLTSPFCNLMISFIRYKKIFHSPSSWRPNEELVTKSTIALVSVILYALILTWINAHFEFQSFNVYNVCLDREKAKLPKVTFNFIMVLTPVLSVMVLTNAMDLSSYFWLKNRIDVNTKNINKSTVKGNANQVQENHHNNIPIHASVICSLLFIFHIAGFIVVGAQMVQPIEKYLLVIVLTRLNDAIRNPLIATCAFRINDSNAAEDRERKRQLVIEDALKRRHERADAKGSSTFDDTNPVYFIPMENLPPQVGF